MASWIKKGFDKYRGLYGQGPDHRPPNSDQMVEQQRRGAAQNWLNDAGGLDEFGFPSNPLHGLPPAEIAQRIQAMSEQRVEQRRAQKQAQAIHALEGGLGALGEYRPGGAAQLASPFYGQMAQAHMQSASQMEAPDLLSEYRNAADAKASKEAKKARNMKIAGTALQVIGAVAAPFTGGASLALGAAGAGLGAYGDQQAGKGGQQAFQQAGLQNESGAFTDAPMQGPSPGGPPVAEQPAPYGGSGAPGGYGPEFTPTTGPGGGGGGAVRQAKAGGGSGGGAAPGQTPASGAGGGAGGAGGAGPGATAPGSVSSVHPSLDGIVQAGVAGMGPAAFPVLAEVYDADLGNDGFWPGQIAFTDMQMNELVAMSQVG